MYKQRRDYAHKPEVIVVNYHRISGTTFRRHLDYILSHYKLLSPEFFLRWLDDKETIERPSVVFSFDDGYLSFCNEIYPIIKESQLPVFMFVPTGYIGTRNFLWEDELEVAFRKTKASQISINGRRFHLFWRLYRTDFHESILRYLRYLDMETRSETKKDILTQLDVSLTEEDMRAYRFPDWPQILEMKKSGLVVFGSHTVNHENLGSLSNDAIRYELQESKRELENRIGRPVQAFAYPYGEPASFNGSVINELEKAGYFCAFTTIQGNIKDKNDRFGLRRVLLFDYQNEGAVGLKLARFWN